MKKLPNTEHPLLIRTDFSDDAIWEEICAELRQPAGELGFVASIEVVDDREYDGLSLAALLALLPSGAPRAFVMLADAETITSPERAILIVDSTRDPARAFRALPSALWAVENNLSMGNIDFDEFLAALGPDGIFRL